MENEMNVAEAVATEVVNEVANEAVKARKPMNPAVRDGLVIAGAGVVTTLVSYAVLGIACKAKGAIKAKMADAKAKRLTKKADKAAKKAAAAEAKKAKNEDNSEKKE